VVVFHTYPLHCNIVRSSKVYKTESVSAMGCAEWAAVSSTESDQTEKLLWQFIIFFTIFTITACIFSYSFSLLL